MVGSRPRSCCKLTLRPDQLIDRLDHVNRNADRARLVGNGPRNRLAHPPRRIRRKFISAAVIEFVHRLHQADVAFLNQIQELQAAVGVALGDRNDQPQVGFDQLLLGDVGFLLAALDDLQRTAQLRRAGPALLLDLLDALIALPQLFAKIAREMAGAPVRRRRLLHLALDLGDLPLERL